MPGLSGTGPCGMGPMTGRGMGKCDSRNLTNSPNPFTFGRGRHRGRGGSFRQGINYSIQEEKEFLVARLDVINKNLKEAD